MFSRLSICVMPAILFNFLTYSEIAFSATSTTTFAVTATVASDCLVSATPLAFPSYDPTSGTSTTGTSTINVTCTLSTPYNIGLDLGTGTGATVNVRKMTRVSGGTDTLNYVLFQDSARTTVWGNTIGTNTVTGTGTGILQPVSVYGSIPASQSVTPASYADTITVTVTY